eukprot:COSAG06_NODE_67658_length_251_cov_0.684211_1_plen_74_part_10
MGAHITIGLTLAVVALAGVVLVEHGHMSAKLLEMEHSHDMISQQAEATRRELSEAKEDAKHTQVTQDMLRSELV